MHATDFTAHFELASDTAGLEPVCGRHRPRLLSGIEPWPSSLKSVSDLEHPEELPRVLALLGAPHGNRPHHGQAVRLVRHAPPQSSPKLIMAGLQATFPAYALSFAKYMAFKHFNHLILHVTNACNFRCEHCFIDFSPKKDLTFDEIARLAADVKDLLWLDIAGGEPFLRKDLAAIVALFNFGVVQIPTNGFYTDRIVDSLKEMRKEVGNKVNLTLSLDGLEETHNKIRRQTTSWQKVWETFEKVRALGFPIKINTAITTSNYDELIPLMRYVRERGPDFHSMILLRGDTLDPDCALPSLETLRKLAEPMFEILDSYSFGREGFATRVMQNYVRTLWNVSLRTIEEERQVMPCQAGKFHQVIYGNGDVSSCEMLPPVGNVRQKSWPEIVASNEFKGQVRSIERGECHCTHNCAMLGSILFRPWPAMKLAAKSVFKVR